MQLESFTVLKLKRKIIIVHISFNNINNNNQKLYLHLKLLHKKITEKSQRKLRTTYLQIQN